MKSLQSAIGAFLDKVDAILTTNPARAIGYGAAVVVYLVANFLASKGILNFQPMSFDDSVIAALAAITFVVTVVESIRRFVYAPQTYIEDLADAARDAHEQAHAEEEFQRAMAQAVEQAKATKTRVSVGSAKAAGAKDSAN